MTFNFILRCYASTVGRLSRKSESIKAKVFLFRTKKLPTAEQHAEQAKERQLQLAARLQKFLGINPTLKPNLPSQLLYQSNNNGNDPGKKWEEPCGVVCIDKLTKLINEKIRSLPYFVERTAYGKSLPVYTRFRHSRQQRFTVLRRIYGDIHSLAKDLRSVFPPEHVVLKERKRQIYIKGLKDLELKLWLADRGF